MHTWRGNRKGARAHLRLRGTQGATHRRVGLHNPDIAQVAQREQILFLAGAVDPPAAKGERVKVLVDKVEQLLRLGQAQRDVAHLRV